MVEQDRKGHGDVEHAGSPGFSQVSAAMRDSNLALVFPRCRATLPSFSSERVLDLGIWPGWAFFQQRHTSNTQHSVWAPARKRAHNIRQSLIRYCNCPPNSPTTTTTTTPRPLSSYKSAVLGAPDVCDAPSRFRVAPPSAHSNSSSADITFSHFCQKPCVGLNPTTANEKHIPRAPAAFKMRTLSHCGLKLGRPSPLSLTKAFSSQKATGKMEGGKEEGCDGVDGNVTGYIRYVLCTLRLVGFVGMADRADVGRLWPRQVAGQQPLDGIGA